ncbi:MAG: peroxide stress protein YaaA, partial [Actinobacteria bacterium]|nr:peroxide stress protein YaaA [Actinomycetota bacterium]
MLLVGGADFWVVASFFILLPPSEGKAEGGLTTKPWRETSGAFGKQLSAQRTELVQRLVTLKGGDEKLLGVKGVHLGRARAANAHLKGAPSLPAFERYTGVVWDHLDLSTLTAPQRTRALRSIVVISGLLGAVRADDPTPDYRLKMGARMAPMGLVSRYWHDHLSAVLNKAFAGSTVIDLLPNEHRA